VIVGRSVEGRVIDAFDQGVGDVGVLVFGAIHGDEPGAAELCHRFIARLRRDPPPARTIVVPVANPDGLVRATKNNAHDIDLNRNFAATNWVRAHPPGYDPGAQPLSEPESQALAALIDRWQPRVLVAVHQPLRCVNWDGSGRALAEQMALLCGYPAVASVGYPTPGSFGSRYGVDDNRCVITLELSRPVPDADWETCLGALTYAAGQSPP
jgi:protein MpaA